MDNINHYTQVFFIFDKHFKGKDYIGIEIGTGPGTLTEFLLIHQKNLKKIYTMDPWKHVDGALFEASLPQEALDSSREMAYARLKKFSEEGRVEIFHIGSDGALSLMPKEKVDFVWIDGNHDKDQVRRDIKNYLPLIKKGGIIGGHDYGLATLLKETVDSIFGDRVISGVDFTWWVYI